MIVIPRNMLEGRKSISSRDEPPDAAIGNSRLLQSWLRGWKAGVGALTACMTSRPWQNAKVQRLIATAPHRLLHLQSNQADGPGS